MGRYLAKFGKGDEVEFGTPNCTALIWLKLWHKGCCWGSYDLLIRIKLCYLKLVLGL